jgi:hypothetical protein
MSHQPILDPNRTYTFSQYFDLNADVFDLITELGYELERCQLQLPQFTGNLDQLAGLKQRLDGVMPLVDFVNETARREMLIAPIVSEVVSLTRARLNIEFPIQVSMHLQGILDYLLRTKTQLVVIEAKQADLTRGMTQLEAELIALDAWTDSAQPQLLGAVTTGTIWQFAVLDRSRKLIKQGLNLYRITEDIESVVRILLAGLEFG